MSCDKCQQPVPDGSRSVSRLGRRLLSLTASRQEKTSRWLLSGRSTRSPNKRSDSWKPAGGGGGEGGGGGGGWGRSALKYQPHGGLACQISSQYVFDLHIHLKTPLSSLRGRSPKALN